MSWLVLANVACTYKLYVCIHSEKSNELNNIYFLSIQSGTGTLIGYTHTETANATKLVIWCNVERVSLTLVT